MMQIYFTLHRELPTYFASVDLPAVPRIGDIVLWPCENISPIVDYVIWDLSVGADETRIRVELSATERKWKRHAKFCARHHPKYVHNPFLCEFCIFRSTGGRT